MEEYWIVDSKRREITVYNLTDKRFGRGKTYTERDSLQSRESVEFTLLVKEVFA